MIVSKPQIGKISRLALECNDCPTWTCTILYVDRKVLYLVLNQLKFASIIAVHDR